MRNIILRSLMLLLCASVFFTTGCISNHFTGEGDHRKATQSVGEVPEEVPSTQEFAVSPKKCEVIIRDLLLEKNVSIDHIGDMMIKTDKILLTSSSFGQAILGGGQSFYRLTVFLSETKKGTTVLPDFRVYQKGSITLEEDVTAKWPDVVKGLRHDFFSSLAEKIPS